MLLPLGYWTRLHPWLAPPLLGQMGFRPSAQGRGLWPSKDQLRLFISIDETHEESPLAIKGWQDWADSVRSKALDPIFIEQQPQVGKGGVRIFAQTFQPVRFALVKGYRFADLQGLMFHGWVPSMVFYGIAETLLPRVSRDELIRIIWDFSEGDGPPRLFNAVQVLKVSNEQDLYFTRVNPVLRISDTDFNVVDGSRFGPGP